MGEVHCPKQAVINEQLITVAKRSEHCPDSLCACLLNEEGMQEEEALQGQSIVAQALRALALLLLEGKALRLLPGLALRLLHSMRVAAGCNQYGDLISIVFLCSEPLLACKAVLVLGGGTARGRALCQPGQ